MDKRLSLAFLAAALVALAFLLEGCATPRKDATATLQPVYANQPSQAQK